MMEYMTGQGSKKGLHGRNNRDTERTEREKEVTRSS